jgi:hypothetical protein
MPFSAKQVKTARAIKGGFKPDSPAMKGFTKKFAKYVLKKGKK